MGNKAWVLGFLSANNLYAGGGRDLLDGRDAAGLFGWIDNYCRDHPLETISLATGHLVWELKKPK